MFEKKLAATFKRIFDLDKVTYDEPGQAGPDGETVRAQECLFIDIQKARVRVKDGVETARVDGVVTIFAQETKLPFGYMTKKILRADPEDTHDLFFHALEENAGTVQNLTKRTASFVYFYSGQYDPDIGTINQLDIEVDYE